jgi:hypothetical protein
MATDICQEVIRGGFIIAAAGFAAWLGLKVFLRQKEFDLIKQRYLEGAVDVIAAHHEEVQGIVCHNWARCLHVLMAFQDEKDSFNLEELNRGFLEPDSSKFHAIAHHRLQVLVGSQVFWEVYELALVFAVNANFKVTKEIPETIRLKLTTNKINADIAQVIEMGKKLVQKLDADSHRFAALTRELEVVASMLQTENMKFKNVLAFRNKPEIKASVERLEKEFADELKHIRYPAHNLTTHKPTAC